MAQKFVDKNSSNNVYDYKHGKSETQNSLVNFDKYLSDADEPFYRLND